MQWHALLQYQYISFVADCAIFLIQSELLILSSTEPNFGSLAQINPYLVDTVYLIWE